MIQNHGSLQTAASSSPAGDYSGLGIALGETAGKNSGCIGGEEEHKHDLLVQGTGHLAGKEVAWLLPSAPRAVFVSYPRSGNITERLLGAGTGPTVPSAHRLLTSSCLLCLAEPRGCYPLLNMGQGEFPPGPCIPFPRQIFSLLRCNMQESSTPAVVTSKEAELQLCLLVADTASWGSQDKAGTSASTSELV